MGTPTPPTEAGADIPARAAPRGGVAVPAPPLAVVGAADEPDGVVDDPAPPPGAGVAGDPGVAGFDI